ncbi:MAG TPA: hypothetical protein VFW67_09700 [Burkholderiaceae bacterium]|nr:hypothetical protein [Burkholderiaceae bacterium]
MKTMLRWWVMCAVVALAACGGGEEADTGHYAGGVLTGLKAGNSVLLSSGTQSLTLSADGTYRFGRFPKGTAYNITATSSSDTQACAVSNGSGQIADADIDNIVVSCVDTFGIGGTLSGYAGGHGPVQVALNGGEPVSLTADGAFHFATRLASGTSYNAALVSVPETLVCSLTNGSGLVASTDVTSITVACEPALAGVSFTVTGLVTPDSVTVQLNGSGVDALPARTRRVTSAANGSYSFNLAVPVGSTYDVVIAGQAVGNTCTVANGSGTLGVGGTSNVMVACSPNRYVVSGTVEFSPYDFVRLRLNGSEELLVNGTQSTQVFTEVVPFQFLTTVPYGGSYLVEVIDTPAFYIICTVTSGSGTMPAGAVTNVVVTCENFG